MSAGLDSPRPTAHDGRRISCLHAVGAQVHQGKNKSSMLSNVHVVMKFRENIDTWLLPLALELIIRT